MKQITGKRALSMLLTVLLVGAGVVPAASAEVQTGEGIDFDQYAIPELKVNGSIETIAISGGWSVGKELGETDQGTYGVPFGSIIVHAADGTTRVFDRNGTQLLSISDERSEKIPTPAAVEKPCTKVHQLPNNSCVYHHGDRMFVFNAAGELILIVINENTTSNHSPNGTVSQDSADTSPQTVHGRPAVGEKVPYQGSESVFSVFYNPVTLSCALGALIAGIVCAAYLLFRKRGKNGVE